MNKKNLLYVAVYGNKDYVKLFNLLFSSLVLSKNDSSDFSLLVMTAPSLKDDILRTISSMNSGVELLVWASEEKPDKFGAAFARYHIFELEQIDQFEKILYLDTDVLINGALSDVFHNDLSEGTIYCLPEADELLGDLNDYYGKSLFIEQGLERCLIERGFTSGAILFKNGLVVRHLFAEVLKIGSESRKNGRVFSCLDQPFLNLLATSKSLINLDLLPKYMVNNPVNVTGGFVINHFPGGVGNFGSKFSKMSKFFLGMIRQRLPVHLWSIFLERLSSAEEGVGTVRLEKNIFLAELTDKTFGFLFASSASSIGLFIAVPSFEVFPVRFSEDILRIEIAGQSPKDIPIFNENINRIIAHADANHQSKQFEMASSMKSHVIRLLAFQIGMLREQGADARRLTLSNQLDKDLNGIVKYGPFKGLKLGDISSWSGADRASMLLGLYEQELLQSLSQLSKNFKTFINIGAADGYYAIGVLVARLFEKSICYEMSDLGQQVINKNACLNGVSDQIVVRGVAISDFHEEISDLDASDSVLLVDIEGAEFDLFNEGIPKKFRQSVIFVELHERFVSDGLKKLERLRNSVCGSFQISTFTTTSRDLSQFAELEALGDTDRWLLCSEGRPYRMNWLRLDPVGYTS